MSTRPSNNQVVTHTNVAYSVPTHNNEAYGISLTHNTEVKTHKNAAYSVSTVANCDGIKMDWNEAYGDGQREYYSSVADTDEAYCYVDQH